MKNSSTQLSKNSRNWSQYKMLSLLSSLCHTYRLIFFLWGKFLWFSIFPQRAKNFPHSTIEGSDAKRKLNEQRRRHKIKWHYLKLFLTRKYMRQFSIMENTLSGSDVPSTSSYVISAPFRAASPFNFRFYYPCYVCKKRRRTRLIFEAKQRGK
jgi:hypothetical protein